MGERGSLRRAERVGIPQTEETVCRLLGPPFWDCSPVEAPLTPRLPASPCQPLKTSFRQLEMTLWGPLSQAPYTEARRPRPCPSHELKKEGKAGSLLPDGLPPLHVGSRFSSPTGPWVCVPKGGRLRSGLPGIPARRPTRGLSSRAAMVGASQGGSGWGWRRGRRGGRKGEGRRSLETRDG